MSDVAPEQTTAAPTQEPQGQPTAAPDETVRNSVYLTTVETGRTHGVSGGATFDLIRDTDGNPEVEYALVAEIDGVQVPLQTFSFSALQQLAASEKSRQQSAQQG